MLTMPHPSQMSAGGPGFFVALPRVSRGQQRQSALHEHLQSLQRHVLQCRQARGRWNSLRCAAEAIHGLLAPRFVTTVTVVTIAMALCLAGM